MFPSYKELLSEMNTDPDSDPIRIQGFEDQKLEKIYSCQNFFLLNYNLPILRPP
jgi:hypothetical protein